MDKFYTCKYDHAFKCVFLDNADDSLIKDLIEYVLKVKIKEIKSLRNEQSSDNVNLRSSLLDSLMEIGKIRLGIELNSKVNKYMYFKNTNYLFYDVSHNFRIGKKIDDSKIFIQVNFTYGLKKKKKLRNDYYFMDKNQDKLRNDIILIDYNMDVVSANIKM